MFEIKNGTEIKAGKLTITNTDTKDVTLSMYVVNKDTVPATLKAGAVVTITTDSAAETFMYMSQATDKLTVVLAEG